MNKRSRKDDLLVLKGQEPYKVGELVKLGDLWDGEYDIGETKGIMKPKYWYYNKQVKNLFNGEYRVCYNFHFEPELSEIEKKMFEKGNYNPNWLLKITDIDYIRVVNI